MKRHYTRARVCPRCKGYRTIYRTDGAPMLCPECDGRGTID